MSDEKEDQSLAIVIPDRIDPDSMDELSARTKIALLKEVTKDGRTIPSDDEGVGTVLKILSSMDSQTKNRRQHVIEERTVDAASQAAANVAAIIRMGGGGNPFVGGAEKAVDGQVVRREPVLPDVAPVDRQDYIGVDELKYEDFVNENVD